MCGGCFGIQTILRASCCGKRDAAKSKDAASYNAIQGRSLERLAALSDGIFAVAMTLLVLDLHIPSAEHVQLEWDLLHALGALAPQWVACLMSFLTLGIFWAGQQTQLNHLREGSRDLAWIHLAFLFTITLMPLTTRLLAEFIQFRLALVLYWVNILMPGAMLYWSWKHAMKHGLVKIRRLTCAGLSADGC